MEKDCYRRCDNFSEIGNLTFSVEDVEKELKVLNVDKSPGPDGIHPKLLRSLASNPSFVNAVYTLGCILRVNSWVQEFNYHLKVLGDKDVNLIYVNTHHIFSDAATGLLHEHCASRKSSDIKHLNKTGIFKLRDLFKECIMNRKKSKGQEVPWCYPSHNSSSSPMEPFDHSVVPKNCVLRSKRRFSLGSCDSGRGGSGLSPQVSSLAAEPGVPGLDTYEDSHSLSHAPPLP